ncbi:hypothetical protein Tco_0481589 [Tanacetum coccineum]
MGVTLSGSQGLSSPQANGYVVKAFQIRCWLPGYPKLDGFHLPYSWNEKWLVQEGTALGADFLVADSKFMKVAFGVDFKMLLFNPLVFSTKDLSRNLKLTVSNSSLGEDFPTGKGNGIVSTGRSKVIPAGVKIYLRLDLQYMMIKYSFNDDEEYVAVKEDEYDDLTVTRKDIPTLYQKTFN